MRWSLALVASLLIADPALAGVVSPSLPLTGPGSLSGSTTLAVGEPLLVVLPGEGPGHAWEARPADPALLEPQTAHCAAARGSGTASVPSCFAWAARAPGATVLTFVYRRHWETSPDGVLRYDLTVTVRR